VGTATFASVLGELVSIGLVFAAPARCASKYTPPDWVRLASRNWQHFIVLSIPLTKSSIQQIPTETLCSAQGEHEEFAVPA
jgi:hypothetical protein